MSLMAKPQLEAAKKVPSQVIDAIFKASRSEGRSSTTAEQNDNCAEKATEASGLSKPELVQCNPDIVDWDGPNDPAYPRNWHRRKKGMHVALISAFTLCA